MPVSRRVAALLALYTLAQLAQATWVISRDRTEPFRAIEVTYRASVLLHRAMRDPHGGLLFSPDGRIPLIESSRPHPPLPALLVQPLYLAAEPSPGLGALGNLLWLPLLFWAVFCLGRRLSDDAGGLLAVLVLGAFPQVLGHRTLLMPFLPCAALVAASAAALVAWHEERRTRDLLLLGLFAGLGMLTRYDFAFSILALAGWHLAVVEPGRRRQALRRLVVAALVAALVGGWWYLGAFGRVFRFYRGEGLFSTVVKNDGIELWSLANLTFHPRRLFTVQMSIPLGAACAAALVALLRRRRPAALLLLLWIALPLVCLFFLPMKKSRYALSLLPAFALALALWLRALPPASRRALCLTAGALALLPPLVLVHHPGAGRWWPMLDSTPATWGNDVRRWEDALDLGRIRPWTGDAWDRALERLARTIGPARRGEPVRDLFVAEDVVEYVLPIWYRVAVRDVRSESWLAGLPAPEQRQALRRAEFLVLSARPPRAALAREAARRPPAVRIRLPDGNHALVYGPRGSRR